MSEEDKQKLLPSRVLKYKRRCKYSKIEDDEEYTTSGFLEFKNQFLKVIKYDLAPSYRILKEAKIRYIDFLSNIRETANKHGRSFFENTAHESKKYVKEFIEKMKKKIGSEDLEKDFEKFRNILETIYKD